MSRHPLSPLPFPLLIHSHTLTSPPTTISTTTLTLSQQTIGWDVATETNSGPQSWWHWSFTFPSLLTPPLTPLPLHPSLSLNVSLAFSLLLFAITLSCLLPNASAVHHTTASQCFCLWMCARMLARVCILCARLHASFSSLFRQPSPTLKPFPSQTRDRSETDEMEMEEWREDEYGMAESQIGWTAAQRAQSHRWMNSMSFRGSGGCKYLEWNKQYLEKCGGKKKKHQKKTPLLPKLQLCCHLIKLHIDFTVKVLISRTWLISEVKLKA